MSKWGVLPGLTTETTGIRWSRKVNMKNKQHRSLHLPWAKEHRCTSLLVSLVVLLVIFFFADGSTRGGRILMTVATTTVFIGGIAAIGNSLGQVIVGIMLMFPPVIMDWLSTAMGWEDSHLLLVPNLYSLPFYLFLIYVTSAYVFHKGKVTPDRMQGAACIYLMLGLLWANIYRVIYYLNSAAFDFTLADSDSFLGPFRELLYFSFVTLTTLGYGDTVPLSPHARVFALFEAVSGVLFVGILIARLAGALDDSKKS